MTTNGSQETAWVVESVSTPSVTAFTRLLCVVIGNEKVYFNLDWSIWNGYEVSVESPNNADEAVVQEILGLSQQDLYALDVLIRNGGQGFIGRQSFRNSSPRSTNFSDW